MMEDLLVEIWWWSMDSACVCLCVCHEKRSLFAWTFYPLYSSVISIFNRKCLSVSLLRLILTFIMYTPSWYLHLIGCVGLFVRAPQSVPAWTVPWPADPVYAYRPTSCLHTRGRGPSDDDDDEDELTPARRPAAPQFCALQASPSGRATWRAPPCRREGREQPLELCLGLLLSLKTSSDVMLAGWSVGRQVHVSGGVRPG